MKKIILGSVVLATVLAVGLILWNTAGADSSHGYRLTRAAIGSVTEAVSATGTVEATNQANANFAAAGTVSSISVAEGQVVAQGQVLAQLDTATLQATVDQDEAALGTAQAKLASDEAARAAAATTTTTTTPATTGATPTTPTSGPGGSSSSTSTTNPTTSGSGGTGTGSGGTGSGGTGSGGTGSGGTGSGGTGSGGGSTGTPSRGTTTTTTPGSSSATNAQTDVSETSAHATKTAAVIEAVGTSNATGSSQSSTGSGGSGGTGQAATPTLAQIDADQAAIYEAESSLFDSKQSLAESTLTSPIAGRVFAINIAVGDTVSAGVSGKISPTATTSSSSSSSSSSTGGFGAASSTSQSSDSSSSSTSQFTGDIVIEDTGGYEVVATVPSTSIGPVKVGDHAVVTPASAQTSLTGTVSSIDSIPTTSNGTTTFTIEVAIDHPTASLYSGTSAGLVIVTDQKHAVLTVPTSAISTNGKVTKVTLLHNGKAISKKVTVGAVGAIRTQVTAGLTDGQQVALANLSTPIPTSQSSTGAGGSLTNGLSSGSSFRTRSFGGG